MKTYNEFITEAKREMSGKEIYAAATKAAADIEDDLQNAFGNFTRVLNQRDVRIGDKRVHINFDAAKGDYIFTLDGKLYKGVKKDKLVAKIQSLTK